MLVGKFIIFIEFQVLLIRLTSRYGVTLKGEETLYAIVNPTSRGRGFVCAWKLRKKGNQYPVHKARTAGISRKTITSFSIK